MKILVEGSKQRYEKFMPDSEAVRKAELFFCERGCSDEALLSACRDAEVLCVDAISPVSRELMEQMPNLKMVHSEGVGFERIDVGAAAKLGIFVCNNKGCNAGAVAEQAILLMLALLRKGIAGDAAVRAGRQMEMKEYSMLSGITELGDCKLGLIGFGDIARATASRLMAFGCEVYYFTPHKKPPEMEAAYRVKYLPLHELASHSDIISIHTAVTKQTIGMINRDFLSRMKRTAYLINTARGEIVDNMALREALCGGVIAGAGLDTIYPEPTTKDNPLVDLPPEYSDRVVYSPHLGGITTGSFRRAHGNMWQSIEKVLRGERPNNIVNGL